MAFRGGESIQTSRSQAFTSRCATQQVNGVVEMMSCSFQFFELLGGFHVRKSRGTHMASRSTSSLQTWCCFWSSFSIISLYLSLACTMACTCGVVAMMVVGLWDVCVLKLEIRIYTRKATWSSARGRICHTILLRCKSVLQVPIVTSVDYPGLVRLRACIYRHLLAR
jgi:hypothetical protein